MTRIFKTFVIFLLAVSKVSAQVPAATIPDFNFYMAGESMFTNKNLEPGKMLFFFFFDSDCDHCQHAMMNLNQHYQEYKKAAIYLLSLDQPEKMKVFVKKYAPNLAGKKNVTLLWDKKNEFVQKFRPRKYPSMFLFSPERKLLEYEDNEASMFRFLKHVNTAVK